MSASILPFHRRGTIGGAIWVVPCSGQDVTWWTIYSQSEGADEPQFEGDHEHLDDAVEAGRLAATRRGARFLVDFGVLGGGAE